MISAPLQSNCWFAAVTSRGGGAEQDVPEGGQREPQKENKLESKIEGEPVDDADKALNHAAVIMC
jgi:hypothetical protein